MRPHLPMVRAALATLALLIASCGDGDMDLLPSGPLVFPEEPFRATRPAPGAMAAYAPPQPERFTLTNGLQVMLVERQTIPYVSWYLTFPGGSMMDPPGKEGLASLCMNVGFQATFALTRQERELMLADMGAQVGIGIASNTVLFSGGAMLPHLDATIRLWNDLFRAPALSQENFDGTLRVRVNSLAVGASQTPAAIASRVSSRLHFGPTHPFNRTITTQSLQAITLPDCRDFFARVVQASGAKLYVSGALGRSGLLAAFARLDMLPSAGTMAPVLPPAERVPGKVFFVHSPAAAQSIITLRGTGPARTAPEYFAAELMAGVLAGDTTSRIGANVREMRGYAYSWSGGFSYNLAGGSFFFSAPVRADATVESVFEVLEEMRKLREAGVTMEELERERTARVAGLPYQFETAGGTLAQYDSLDAYGIPFDYFATYAARFTAVTPAAAQGIAVQHLAPAALQVLVVGDGPSVLPKLKALAAMRPELMGGGEVQVLDSEGRPTTPP